METSETNRHRHQCFSRLRPTGCARDIRTVQHSSRQQRTSRSVLEELVSPDSQVRKQSIYSAGDHISIDFVQELPNTAGDSNKIDPFEGLQSKSGAQSTNRKVPEFGSGLPLGLRIHPSLNGEHRRLHLDFDVVPHIPIGPLRQVLSNILGIVDFRDNSDYYVSILEDMLKGIHVRCLYASPSKQAGGSAEILGWQNIERGRRFQIKEVRRAKKVPEFERNGQNYSVESYFNSEFIPHMARARKLTDN
jgi:hypothetical protein